MLLILGLKVVKTKIQAADKKSGFLEPVWKDNVERQD